MQTIYKCEGCGKEFDSWQECGDHEKAHIKVKSSQLLFNQGESHPEVIKVVFSDGSSGNYMLLGNITTEEKDLDPALKKFTELKNKFIIDVNSQKDSSPAIGSSQESQDEDPFTF